VSSERGGLAIGTGLVSFVLAAMIAMFVAFLTSTGADTPADQKARGGRGASSPVGVVPPRPPDEVRESV
jgi:hypothetical protein